MTEYLRINGLNNIQLDQCATAPGAYCMPEGDAPRGMSTVLTEEEVLSRLSDLPTCVRAQALNRGLSVIELNVTIRGADDTVMEANEHALNETLEDAMLFICSHGERGTQATLQVKTDQALATSYKTIYWGKLDEQQARAILSARIKAHELANCLLTLYCEPYWRPLDAITLGPNEIYCPSFEEDGNADGRADDWDARAASVLSMESIIVLHGCQSQQVDTNAANEGIESTAVAAPAAPANDATAYAWVCRPAAGSDIRAILRDTTLGVDRATALYSNATTTAVGKSGETWRRLELTATNTIVPANMHELWIESTAVTVTTFYVDKCFLKFDTTTIPDEWCDHWLLYNHYDTTEGAAHEGHINYFDVDDLKGDTEARTLIRVELEQQADGVQYKGRDLIIGRRTRPEAGCFLHWLEAEDSSAATNWGVVAEAACSAGNKRSNAANTTGSATFDILTMLGAGTVPEMLGDFDVFGAIYTNDIDHTWFRLYYDIQGTENYNRWVKATTTSHWQLVKLGTVSVDPFIRSGVDFYTYSIVVEYAKDATDTASLDFIWLVHKREPEVCLAPFATGGLVAGDYWGLGQDEDFDYVGIEKLGPPLHETHAPVRYGDFMTLKPCIENRLYLVNRTWDSTNGLYQYDAHGPTGTPPLMIVNIDYLPQYISPME